MNKKNIIMFLVVCIMLFGGLLLITISNKNKKKNPDALLSGYHYVEIDVDNYGTILLELDANTAPITVTNFIRLVKNHFYDGTTFHRIINGFMIQGGTYDEDGNKQEANTIKGEFSSNGVTNNISHLKGTISMARNSVDMNSASSGFFITQADRQDLDGNYAAFGYVMDGMDVVDEIAKKAKPTDGNGSINLKDRPVINTIRVVKGY